MTRAEITREELQALADSPIGSKEMQVRADREAQHQFKADPTLAALRKRIAKRWLPMGKTVPSRAEIQEREQTLRAKQTDIEDSIEEAGGNRGAVSK